MHAITTKGTCTSGAQTGQLTIVYRELSSLRLNPRNARRHSKKQIAKIARSIKEFGFNNAILVDSSEQILCGDGRYLAAQLLGMSSVPTVYLDHMTPEQRRAYVLADNRLADESDFDREIVALELEELLDLDLGFEITDIGFDVPEIDLLINELHADPPEPAAPAPGSVPALARPGDLWALGKHFLLCGDALDPESFRRHCQTNVAGGDAR